MGLDAVVVVCSETRSGEWHFGVSKIDLTMFGHNPDPMPDQKIARVAWADMVLDGRQQRLVRQLRLGSALPGLRGGRGR